MKQITCLILLGMSLACNNSAVVEEPHDLDHTDKYDTPVAKRVDSERIRVLDSMSQIRISADSTR